MHHTGRIYSNETKRKMSEAQRGEKNHHYGKHYSKEIREKRSISSRGEKNNFYGKHHSEESKRKMSISSLNNKNRVPHNSKSIIADYHIFSSFVKASNALGLSKLTINKKIKSHQPGYFYIENTNRLRRKNLNV